MTDRELRNLGRAASRLSAARQNLYHLIREAHDDGRSLREIAKATGVSHETIRLMLKDDSR